MVARSYRRGIALLLAAFGLACASPPEAPPPPPEPTLHDGIRIEFGELSLGPEGMLIAPTRFIAMVPNPLEPHGFLLTPDDDREFASEVTIRPPASGAIQPLTTSHAGAGVHQHRFHFDPGDPLGWWEADVRIDGELALAIRYEVVTQQEAGARVVAQESWYGNGIEDWSGLDPDPESGWLVDPVLELAVPPLDDWEVRAFDRAAIARGLAARRRTVPEISARRYVNSIAQIRFALAHTKSGVLTAHQMPAESIGELTHEAMGAIGRAFTRRGGSYFIRANGSRSIAGRSFLSTRVEDIHGNLTGFNYGRIEGPVYIHLSIGKLGNRDEPRVERLLDAIRAAPDEAPADP